MLKLSILAIVLTYRHAWSWRTGWRKSYTGWYVLATCFIEHKIILRWHTYVRNNEAELTIAIANSHQHAIQWKETWWLDLTRGILWMCILRRFNCSGVSSSRISVKHIQLRWPKITQMFYNWDDQKINNQNVLQLRWPKITQMFYSICSP